MKEKRELFKIRKWAGSLVGLAIMVALIASSIVSVNATNTNVGEHKTYATGNFIFGVKYADGTLKRQTVNTKWHSGAPASVTAARERSLQIDATSGTSMSGFWALAATSRNTITNSGVYQGDATNYQYVKWLINVTVPMGQHWTRNNKVCDEGGGAFHFSKGTETKTVITNLAAANLHGGANGSQTTQINFTMNTGRIA